MVKYDRSHQISKKSGTYEDVYKRQILTSGLTFFVATASVALTSKMELIRSLCLLISRGALISMFVILLILPALLILFTKVIPKTTYHWFTSKERVKA